MVGNDFVAPRPRPAAASGLSLPVATLPVVSTPVMTPQVVSPVYRSSFWRQALDVLHRYSLISFALLCLIVGAAAIRVGGSYWAAHIVSGRAAVTPPPARTIAGLNLTVPSDQLAAKLQQITSQPASLTVGGQTVAIGAETIKGWLQISASRDKSRNYVRVKADAIEQSLTALAQQFVKAPVDQVTVNHDGVASVVVAGRDGTRLSQPETLRQQAAAVAKTVMDGKGLRFDTPLASQAFAAVTPAAFDKLIEVNVASHQMYLYEKGQLTSTYAISAGAPETPTPLGQFKIWSKLPKQTMTGYNPNGSRYVQPNVPWISYFDHSGDAIHGNYWRPASVFGAANTSHGCVSLPVDQAKVIYDWAPIGTTVITHA